MRRATSQRGARSATNDDGARFPGQRSLAQRRHWDDATAAVVLARVRRPDDVSFFTAAEEGTAAAVLDRLVGQGDDGPKVPLVNVVAARLARGETDGWRYADLPEDAEVWRRSLAALDDDARERFGAGFADVGAAGQDELLTAVQAHKSAWHGLPASHIWNLWLRYACVAFYAHPSVWDEIGFPGPAYPRGYANLGVDRREHFEVRDAQAGADGSR